MSVEMRTEVRWTCDLCGDTAVSNSAASLPRPAAYRAWAQVIWNQDAGFDFHGAAWANRVSNKNHDLSLCAKCADEVFDVIERIKERTK